MEFLFSLLSPHSSSSTTTLLTGVGKLTLLKMNVCLSWFHFYRFGLVVGFFFHVGGLYCYLCDVSSSVPVVVFPSLVCGVCVCVGDVCLCVCVCVCEGVCA